MGTYELIICGATVVGVALTAIKLWWEIRKDRITTRQILDHISSLRQSVEKNVEAIKRLESSRETLQKAVDNKTAPPSAASIEERKIALKEAELARKKERDEWNKVIAVGKGIGWALKRVKDGDDDS